VNKAGVKVSSLDLLGDDFVLLSANPGWMAAASGLGINAVQVGADITFPEGQPFEAVFGLPQNGAVLVRPDGIIAWRTLKQPDESAAKELRRALSQVACGF